jgi:hypothetical protein
MTPSPVTSTSPLLSLTQGGVGAWLIAAVVGFAIGYVLTPTEYEDEHGHPVDKYGRRI